MNSLCWWRRTAKVKGGVQVEYIINVDPRVLKALLCFFATVLKVHPFQNPFGFKLTQPGVRPQPPPTPRRQGQELLPPCRICLGVLQRPNEARTRHARKCQPEGACIQGRRVRVVVRVHVRVCVCACARMPSTHVCFLWSLLKSNRQTIILTVGF